jgi:hypothetical protein
MENIKESVIAKNIWDEDPEYAQQLQDIHDYLKKTPFNKAFPNKYKAIVEHKVLDKTYELFDENPYMPLKSVVTTVLNDLDDDLSPKLIVEMTRVVVDKWEKLTKKTHANKHVEELV